jgi:predicted nucleic acid-binding protein
VNRILVDSNVILDVLEDDPIWFHWSEDVLGRYHDTHTLLINPIVYAEVSVGYENVEEVEQALQMGGFQMWQIPNEALFLAGKVFMAYRKRGGTRRSPLPDFFIGAHAAVEKIPLLTRDVSRYKTDFPTVNLISPE